MSNRSGKGHNRESHSRTTSGPDLRGVREALRKAMPSLQISHNVEALAVFGSVVRGQADADSDVDVLVRFSGPPPGFFDFIRLESQLSEIVGHPVDLVMESALKPRLRDRILAEEVAA